MRVLERDRFVVEQMRQGGFHPDQQLVEGQRLQPVFCRLRHVFSGPLLDRRRQSKIHSSMDTSSISHRGKKYAAMEVTTMFPRAIGSITFHPKRINWSYLSLGSVARNQKNRNRKKYTLAANQTTFSAHAMLSRPIRSSNVPG